MSATHLVGLIGDEDTCTGFILAGIGDVNKQRQRNFLCVSKDTTYAEVEEFYKKLLARNDIGIILITQKIAEQIRHHIAKHDKVIPTIIEIPSKDLPYDPSKDPILKRAKALLGQE